MILFDKKRSFLYISILLLILVGVPTVSAMTSITNLRMTGNSTADYSSGSITLIWTGVNLTSEIDGTTTANNYNLTNITYYVYGAQNSQSGGAFVLIGSFGSTSTIGDLETLTFSNVTGVSANYTFRINATIYQDNGTANVLSRVNSTLSGNVSISTDAEDPSASLSDPSSTSLILGESIKYTCTCSDSVSGLSSCITVVTKPGGEEVSGSGSGTELTFSGTDVNRAGTYGVVCTATDVVGRTKATDQKTFSVSFPTSGGTSGTSTIGTTSTNPISIGAGVTRSIGTLSSTETYTSIAQGGAASFTASGGSHTAKVLIVTSTSATVEVSSTPRQVTLNVGETKEVDLNNNGMNDLAIKLSSVSGNIANLVFRVIQEQEEITPTPSEEPTPTAPPTPGITTGEPTRSSLTWLWWVIIILAVILLVIYFRKKKQ